MRVSPFLINVMLACYCSSRPKDEVGVDSWESSVGREARVWLKENGLIDERDKATAKGIAWVGFICDTPLPVQSWQLPLRPDAEKEWFRRIGELTVMQDRLVDEAAE